MKSLRILLVDDDEEEFNLLKNLISDAKHYKYNLDWANSRERALSVQKKQTYDVYLVDDHLGSANGLDIARDLNRRGTNTPVIFLTSKENGKVDEADQQPGAADYLFKDQLNPTLLERTIRYAIDQKNIQSELDRCLQERSHALQQEILEHKLAQEASQESAARFRALTETTSAAIFIVREMEIRYANPAARLVTGYTHDELVEGKFLELIHLEYRIALKQNGLGNSWAPDQPSRYELKIIRKDGIERWLDLTTGPIHYENQAAWIVTAFDITERDNAERELRKAKNELEERISERTLELRQVNKNLQKKVDESQKRADELDALRNATSMLLSTLDLTALLKNILETACKAITVAEKGVLELITPKTGQLRVSATTGFKDPHFRSVQLLKSKGYPAQAICTQKPLLVKDIFSKSRQGSHNRPTQELKSARSLIVVPFLLQNEPLGALLMTSSQPDVFSKRDLKLLQSFATAAAVAIHNAQLHTEVQRLAVTDPLTGALNRRGFFDTCIHELERLHRYGHPFSMIYMDIDKFKSINDENGHNAGDQVLQVVVERTCLHLRHVDLIGRLGGDEFAILLPETTFGKARRVAERIRQAVTEQPIPFEQKQLQISITLGVTDARTDIADFDTLLASADKAFYQAKQNGGNQVAYFNQPG